MTPRETLEHWQRIGRKVVHEADAKDLLGQIGVPVPGRNPADGRCVAKLCHDDYPHKSDHGLVRLGLSPEAARQAAAEMAERVPGGTPLIEAMEEGAVAEWIIGCKRDATFGPIVLAGPGGILVELIDAAEIRLAPADMQTAGAMLDSGPGARLLKGLRGGEPADRDALARLISRISVFFAENADLISEIEINPVMVRADNKGLIAADALIVLAPAAKAEEHNA
ncbi:MAG: acetate--CoA ligase family protein [Roseovarius sp.]|jgi:acyl-CoA synthetase (NDP forming)|nr:acetate--CoA ligase family protein [Roseovarius sp.]